MNNRKINLGNRDFILPHDWTLISSDNPAGENDLAGDRHELENTKKNLYVVVWYTPTDFRGCEITLDFKNDPKLDALIEHVETNGVCLDKGIQGHHSRRRLFHANIYNLDEFYDKVAALFLSPFCLSEISLYLNSDYCMDVDAEFLQIKIDSDCELSESDILTISLLPYETLQNSLLDQYLYNQRARHRLLPSQYSLILNNSQFERIVMKLNKYIEWAARLEQLRPPGTLPGLNCGTD